VLFHAHDFVLLFLPATLLVFLLARRFAGARPGALLAVLLTASLIFYGAWNWRYAILLLASITANFACSVRLLRPASPFRRRGLLTIGIAGNLGLLFWFKYAGFASRQLAAATGWDAALDGIVLPIGISFYTFQQIAYLVDVWRGETVDRNPLRYALFVSFFPQLIAGPIVHHREFASQFRGVPARPVLSDLAVGVTIFTIGLTKKIVLADSFAQTASPVFAAAATGTAPGLLAAWLAVFAYGLQIYFDFSAYSDMAMGLGRMFGITLPINFASPYQAVSIIDFWRRWHITLSRFLRDYLYIPLGGNRRGPRRRFVNVMLTMVLGGIWHGAGWTFALWGLLHGVLLALAQLWRAARAPRVPVPLARGLTLLSVMLAWVPFRAADLATTGRLYAALAGAHGAGGTPPSAVADLAAALAVRMPGPDWAAVLAVAVVGGGLGLALLAPNTQTLMRRWRPGLVSPGYETGIEDAVAGRAGPAGAPVARVAWRPTWPAAALVGVVFAACLMLLNRASEFIYFQF